MKGKGVLPDLFIKRLISSGNIRADEEIRDTHIQPSSLDLRLGSRGHRIRASFLPQGARVEDVLKSLEMYEFDLSDGAILERGNIYLIPLMESLDLEPHMSGRTNPKSSTGRLDIFTRVITDGSCRFEDIPSGYSGRLYLEIVPKSFTVRVKSGISLNQLRIFCGETERGGLACESEKLTDSALFSYYRENPLLFDSDSQPIPVEDVVIMDGLFMGINLKGNSRNFIGYKAKKNSAVLDLSKSDEYDICDYWEPIHSPKKEEFLILEPEEFYIFASKERVRVPLDLAGEMVEFDAGSGELRTHYAGFFDCGFGFGKTGEIAGTKAVMEVRPHDVPFRIEHGQIFCKLKYERMASRPESYYGSQIGSHYHNQLLTLSKHFKNC